MKLYEEEKQQVIVDVFTDYYEEASGMIYDEYIKRADGVIDCPLDGDETYLNRLNAQLERLADEARKLRVAIFNTTEH